MIRSKDTIKIVFFIYFFIEINERSWEFSQNSGQFCSTPFLKKTYLISFRDIVSLNSEHPVYYGVFVINMAMFIFEYLQITFYIYRY